MSTILPHPTHDQQQDLARMRAMRSMMRDDDPEIEAEAAAVFHMLHVQEFLHQKTIENLERELRWMRPIFWCLVASIVGPLLVILIRWLI